MLSPLLPTALAARAYSQLVSRVRGSIVKHDLLGIRYASTAIEHAHQTGRSEEDTVDVQDLFEPPCHPDQSDPFSHFFDKRTPLATVMSTSSKAKASYEIAAASRRAVASFRQAVGTRSPSEIIAAYENLIRAQQRHARDVKGSTSRSLQGSEVGFPVRKADIQTAIRYLAQHARGEGYMDRDSVKTSQQMFQDMALLFGFRIGPTDLHRQLQTYCLSARDDHDPCQAFRELRASYPDWQTSSVEWNMVISYYARSQEYRRAMEVWIEMLDKGVQPEPALRNTMIRVRLELNDIVGAEAQLQSLASGSDPPGLDTLTTTVQGLCKLVTAEGEKDQQLKAKLRAYAGDLRKAVDLSPGSAGDPAAWHALLRYEAIVADPAHALDTARYARESVQFDQRTLSLLLHLHVDELNELQTSDEALELLDRIHSWTSHRPSLSGSCIAARQGIAFLKLRYVDSSLYGRWFL